SFLRYAIFAALQIVGLPEPIKPAPVITNPANSNLCILLNKDPFDINSTGPETKAVFLSKYFSKFFNQSLLCEQSASVVTIISPLAFSIPKRIALFLCAERE